MYKDVIRKNQSYLIIVKIYLYETKRKRLNEQSQKKKIEIKFEEAIEFPIEKKKKDSEIEWTNKRASESESASKEGASMADRKEGQI